jgi:predicted thioredoxin/glutaredoxin
MTEIKAIVTSGSCSHCSTLKAMLKNKGLLDKVKEIKFETPEGRDFCMKNNIVAVPTCVIISENGKARNCSPKEFEKLLNDGC